MTPRLYSAGKRSSRSSALQWSQLELANASGADVSAIRNFEDGKLAPQKGNVEALRRAFEAAGIQFVSEIGGGTGVRLYPVGGD